MVPWNSSEYTPFLIKWVYGLAKTTGTYTI